jgi:hypothetical protein
MPMMMTPPAMPMMMVVSYLNHHLRTRSGYEGCQKRKCENSECKLLHAHGNDLFLVLHSFNN